MKGRDTGERLEPLKDRGGEKLAGRRWEGWRGASDKPESTSCTARRSSSGRVSPAVLLLSALTWEVAVTQISRTNSGERAGGGRAQSRSPDMSNAVQFRPPNSCVYVYVSEQERFPPRQNMLREQTRAGGWRVSGRNAPAAFSSNSFDTPASLQLSQSCYNFHTREISAKICG